MVVDNRVYKTIKNINEVRFETRVSIVGFAQLPSVYLKDIINLP